MCRGNQTGRREFLHSPARMLRPLAGAKTRLLNFRAEKIEEKWSREQDDRMAVDLIRVKDGKSLSAVQAGCLTPM